MQTTYHINPSEVNDSWIKAIRELFKNEEEIIITISSKKKREPSLVKDEEENENLFYSLFGSWQGEEASDELIKNIYSARVNSTDDLEI